MPVHLKRVAFEQYGNVAEIISPIQKAGKGDNIVCFAFCQMATVVESTARDGTQRET